MYMYMYMYPNVSCDHVWCASSDRTKSKTMGMKMVTNFYLESCSKREQSKPFVVEEKYLSHTSRVLFYDIHIYLYIYHIYRVSSP